MASDYESLEFADHFDCAVFFDCLHHAEDEKAAIHSAWRALKPGGLLITHEPGVGHSRSPDSVRAMELYGVNERDMPPERIIAAARAIGFTEWRIYPLPQVVINRFYRLEPNPWLFSPAGMRRALHLLRMAFFPSAKAGAIVVLKK